MPASRTEIRLQQKLDAATRDKTVQKVVDRVLHRALAMTSTDDIRGVIEETRDAWFDLGLEPVFTAIAFIDEARDSRQLFGAWGRGEAFHFGSVSIKALLASGSKWHAPRRSRRRSTVVRSTKREMQTEFRKVARAIRGRKVPASWANEVSANFTYPNYRHLFYYTGGWVGLDLPREMSKDEMSIGRRLAQAFDVAWRRLVELQEKEDRIREAEITAALERVRSQALGMQESTDIAGVTEILFEQEKRLGLKPVTAQICIDEGDSLHEFVYSKGADARLDIGGRQLFLPKAAFEKHPDFDLSDWKKGKEKSTAYFDLEKVKQMFGWAREIGAVDATVQLPTAQEIGPFHRTIAWFPSFFLMVYAADPLSDDDFAILHRFGRAFDVAYRRFRELQTKEAQNHELTLQNSLERIRAHALSMQSTDDFPSVAAAVFREAEHLNFEVVFSAIGIVHEQQDRIDQWGVARDFSPEHLEMVRQRFPVFDEDPMVVREHFVISKVHQVHPYVEQSFRVSPTPGQLTHVPTFLTAEELTSWLDNMGRLGIWDEEYAASAPREFPPDGMHISTILFDHGYIWFYLNAALNEQQIAEAERFTDVFSFAYDRYLQLQASEDRAHEAQLEASAERVRAAAMEMRSADEIRHVVGVVRRELIALGFSERFPININYLDEKDDENCYVYCSAPNPRQIGLSWTSPELTETDEHTVTYLEVMKISYRPDAFTSSEVWRIDQRDDEFSLQHLGEMLAALGIDPGYDEIFDFGTHVTGIPFAHGQIVVRGNDGLADEQIDIVRPLCDGLSLGFTRFQDFQQLEAEAERARLEAATERVRAAAMDMRSADEIRNVVGVVRRELISLGFPEQFPTIINYFDDDNDEDIVYAYLAWVNPRRHGLSWTSADLWEVDENTVACVFEHPGITQSVRESMASGEVLRQKVAGRAPDQSRPDAFGIDHAFYKHVEFGDRITCIPFTYGQIGLRGNEYLTDEQIAIVRPFCDALSLGFTRFQDFQQLEQASSNKSQFLRRMSHDLRSPMNAIIGYSRLLQRRLADRMDEREARNLANIETSSGNLLSLINDILDLSRIEAGRIEMSEQPVDVGQLANECADALGSIVHENVVLHRDLDDVGVINSDPDRLRQVVMNLLGNATKFTEAGSITLSLKRVSGGIPSTDSSSAGRVGGDGGTSSDTHIELSIADTGIGIPSEDLPHIFDEFRQVERQGGESAEGTGLGLAIAKKTVDLLGGQISATSEVGVGTTFTVRLAAS